MRDPTRRGEIHLGDLARALATLQWRDDEQARAIAACLGFGLQTTPGPRPPTEIYDRQRYPRALHKSDKPPPERPVFVPPSPGPPPLLPANSLECSLQRYYALLDDRDRVQLGLRDVVRRIRAEQDEKRHIALSRLAKRTIAVIAPTGQGPEEARLLAQYAVWLGEKGIFVDLVGESAQTAVEKAPAGEARVVRLWTRAAQNFWAGRQVEQGQSMASGLLLRIEEVGLPAAGVAPGQVLNWRDWTRFDQSPAAEWLLRNLRRWRDGDEIEPEPGTDVGPEASGRSESYSAEVAALLAEIDDLATDPPRRLEIGDRLAELGDPRPGVGVIEIEVPSDEGAEPGAVPERLLDEIDDPATKPPRRLEIGDELERLGDPRHGVGLDENGLPDIEWVEIPTGPFMYQSGETRELPTFWNLDPGDVGDADAAGLRAGSFSFPYDGHRLTLYQNGATRPDRRTGNPTAYVEIFHRCEPLVNTVLSVGRERWVARDPSWVVKIMSEELRITRVRVACPRPFAAIIQLCARLGCGG